MTKPEIPPTVAVAGPSRDSVEKQLDRAVETFRFLTQLMVSSWSILIAGDLLLVGYGVANRAAGLVAAGAVLVAIAGASTVIISRNLVVIAYSAYVSEVALGFDSRSGLVQIFGLANRARLLPTFEKIHAATADPVPGLRQLMRPWSGLGRGLVATFGVAFVAQIGLALLLYWHFEFPLFGSGAG